MDCRFYPGKHAPNSITRNLKIKHGTKGIKLFQTITHWKGEEDVEGI